MLTVSKCVLKMRQWRTDFTLFTVPIAAIALAIGFAALIPTASKCLLEDTPEAYLLTESISWAQLCSLEKPFSFIQYVECVFGCPLSLIPKIYAGMRLTNHLLLGNFNLSSFHDDTFINPVTLKWVKAPAYSNNVKLDHSPALKKAFAQLADLCFLKPLKSSALFTSTETKSIKISNGLTGFMVLRYTPLTYYNVLQSLIKRCF